MSSKTGNKEKIKNKTKQNQKQKKKNALEAGWEQAWHLSNSHPELLQHTHTLLLVLLSSHPEVVFVLHDVG